MPNHLIIMVPGARIELARFQESRDFKSLASTYSATQATETLCNMFKNTCQDFSFLLGRVAYDGSRSDYC